MQTETGWLKAGKEMPSRFSRHLSWAERVLWVLGIAALAYGAFYVVSGLYEQARGDREFIASRASGRESVPLQEGGVIGRIHIPRLDIAAVIFEGTSESVLKKGVGHLTGSAFPADSGNVVLAAHRDTFFRSLKDVREGDLLILEMPSDKFRYLVRTISVVGSDSVEVLKPTPSPTVTLVTCYPFGYIGEAPDRFIVRAEPHVGENSAGEGLLAPATAVRIKLD